MKSILMVQDETKERNVFPPSNSVAENFSLEVKYIKEEEEVDDHLEHVLMKEIEKSECEASVKHEPLFWDEPEKAEDVKALGGADAGSSGSCSAFVVELSACTPFMRGDGGTMIIAQGNVMSNRTSPKPKNTVKSLACCSCEYKTKRKSSLQRHLGIHDRVRVKPFACNHCEYKTDIKGNLAVHVRTHESVRDKPFSCNHCEYKTDRKCSLSNHLRTHESVRHKPFACNHCNFRTDDKFFLNRHLRIHKSVRDKPFVCNHCEYKTDSKFYLGRHLRTHESGRDKPFLCNHCEYKTDRKGSLSNHLRTHESVGDQPLRVQN